jgi:hypothetical protein
MKTIRAARVIVRMRIILVCLALAAVAGLEYRVSQPLAARMTQIATLHTTGPQASPMNLADVMAASR